MTKTLVRDNREILTRENIADIDDVLDREDVFAKAYWQSIDGELKVVGLRIGAGPDRLVAFFGDTIVRGAGGGYSVIVGVA
jgi:hypothetical protein